MSSGLLPPPVARLTEQLAALDRAYSPGHHGRWVARRRAEFVDAALVDLFAAQSPPPGVALVALGGYGRGQLLPHSDLDLLLLHEDAGSVAPLAEAVLYPLWDIGLDLGHAVRTPAESLAAAVDRLDTLTASLDARLVAGDAAPLGSMRELVLGWVREDPRGFAERLVEARDQRRARWGSASYLLEPDLKEGTGGLRDVQSLGWLAAVVGERPEAPTLDGVGLMGSAERDAIDDAEDFLVRIRSASHLESGRKQDTLRLDQQPQIAREMGFSDEPLLPAVDGLMRALFTHARTVEHVTGAVFERFLGAAPSEAAPDPSPEGVLQAFALAAEQERPMSPSQLDRIQAVALPERIHWTSEVRDAFLRILRAGEPGVQTLDGLDRVGLLERFVPEWGPVRCRPQRDPYHRYTVDVHLLQALAGIDRLLDAPDPDDPMAAEAVATVVDHDALRLGALLHDIGKTGQGNHVPVGARVASAALGRMGLAPETEALAGFMVRRHLLLPDTATRRDLEDEDLILEVAAAIGTPERLAALYLLAVADAGATGPHAWTPWRRTLIRELAGKVKRAFDRGEMGGESAERLERRRSEIRASLSREDAGAVEAFLGRMPPGYLLAVAPEVVAGHFALLASPLGATEVRTVSGIGERTGAHVLTVIAADRPGLLSMVAGALSLAGLSILSAQVFTTEDDVAVDVFEVEGSFAQDVNEERWREFRTSLRRAMEGRLSLDHRVAEKRRSYPAPRRAAPVTVAVDNDASEFFTVIEVGAPDRIGLLFDITRALADSELDVHLAKVATYGERVIDVFYVRDSVGRRITSTDEIGRIEAAVRDALMAEG